MAHKVIWTPRVVQALEEAVRYIEQDSPDNAAAMASRVVAAAEDLARFPRMGRVVPEFEREDLREVLVPPYRLIYRVGRDHVELAFLYHGARDLRRAIQPQDLP